uniref:Putative ovule protein n=1 Tax=Solanum chacoense TaxID=4108 RepID=A0A0V0GX83_SOLCH
MVRAQCMTRGLDSMVNSSTLPWTKAGIKWRWVKDNPLSTKLQPCVNCPRKIFFRSSQKDDRSNQP